MRGKFLFGAASAAMLAALAPAASAQTADAPNDANTTARLNLDQPLTAELAPAGDSDWYRLAVTPGQRYDIRLDAAIPEGATQGFDTLLIVHDAEGAELARNDDSADSLNSALSYRPSAAGDVFVEARGFAEDAAGAYTLRVAAASVPPDDVGNDASTRARVTLGQDQSGGIEDQGDVDWYRLSTRSNQMYRIALNAAAEGGLTDPLLTIVDRDGNELASNDDANESLNSFLEFMPTGNGDVFVVASGFGEAVGRYTLRVDAAPLPADDAGNGRDTRARLSLDQQVQGALDYAHDTDWRRIRLEGGQAYRFALTSTGEGEHAFDTLLKIHNSAGEELASDDDGGEGLNSYLEFTAPSSGDYYVEARGFAEDAAGAYTLVARAGDVPADANTDASLSADGDYREGAITPAGDSDWYRINLANGQAMRLAVNGLQDQGGLQDPLIVLHGPDGAEVARDDDGGDGLNAWLEYAAPAAGAYYLEVKAFSDAAEGRYSITLTPGEIGASTETAEAVSANSEPRSSTIAPAGDVDWFAIELVEGRPYRINVEQAEGGVDPMLRLLDDQGAEVASDDDGGAGVNSYLSYTSVKGGTYYIAVSGFGDSTGAYSVRVSDTDVPGNGNTDENLDAANGDDRLSRIDLPGDLDQYRVELQQGTRYEIRVSGEGETPLTDPFLTVLGIEGQSITTDDDSGPGNDARLLFTPDASDVYYLQASGLGGATGAYRISISPESTRPSGAAH